MRVRRMRKKSQAFCLKHEIGFQSYLNDAVHVWDEAVNADFQQHNQSPAHILPHFTVLITSQCKKTLDTKETTRDDEEGCG